MIRENSPLFPRPLRSLFIKSRFQTKKIFIASRILERKVVIELIYPTEQLFHYQECSFLFMNDGQDLNALKYNSILEKISGEGGLNKLITIAIHAGERIHEYGVSGMPDYKGRGSKAKRYHDFLLEELFPFTSKFFKVALNPWNTAITGFSLGGLSAFDFAWENSEQVSKVGVFSGSFWWRTRPLGPFYEESDRIILQKVVSTSQKPQLKFWFQTGTLDELNDRNQNGIIDSIDDTQDLILALKSKDFLMDQDITYLEVEGGEHNQATWSSVFPQFLKWAFLHNE